MSRREKPHCVKPPVDASLVLRELFGRENLDDSSSTANRYLDEETLLFVSMLGEGEVSIENGKLGNLLAHAVKLAVSSIHKQVDEFQNISLKRHGEFSSDESLNDVSVDNLAVSVPFIFVAYSFAPLLSVLKLCSEGFESTPVKLRSRFAHEYRHALYPTLEAVFSELNSSYTFLQSNRDIVGGKTIFYCYSIKLVRITTLQVLTYLLEIQEQVKFYSALLTFLEDEVASCSEFGAFPHLLLDCIVTKGRGSVNFFFCWNYVLRLTLDIMTKWIPAEYCVSKVQSISLMLVRISTKTSSFTEKRTSYLDLRLRPTPEKLDMKMDSAHATHCLYESSSAESDDGYELTVEFGIQLRALTAFQKFAVSFHREILSIWSFVFPHTLSQSGNDFLPNLILSSPYRRIRLAAAKCTSELLSSSQHYLSHMIGALWKATDRVAMPREIHYIMLNLHQILYRALLGEKSHTVIPALIRCVSVVFKVFPYHLLGKVNRKELREFHKRFIRLAIELGEILVNIILHKEMLDATICSAAVSSLGNFLSISFDYNSLSSEMVDECQMLQKLVQGENGIVNSLIRTKNRISGNTYFLTDIYSALSQACSYYKPFIFHKMMTNFRWKKEMMDTIFTGTEPVQHVFLKFLMFMLQMPLEQRSGNETDILTSNYFVEEEQVLQFWILFVEEVCRANVSSFKNTSRELIFSCVTLAPRLSSNSPSSFSFSPKNLFELCLKHMETDDSAAVRGNCTLAFIRVLLCVSKQNDFSEHVQKFVRMTVNLLRKDDVEYIFFSKASLALVELLRYLEDYQTVESVEFIKSFISENIDDLVNLTGHLFSVPKFQSAAVRLLGCLLTFHDADNYCFLYNCQSHSDQVIDLLCSVLYSTCLPNFRSLNETKAIWNTCFALSTIAVHCFHDRENENQRANRIFHAVFFRLQEEFTSRGNTKVQMACIRTLSCLTCAPSLDTCHWELLKGLCTTFMPKYVSVEAPHGDTMSQSKQWETFSKQLEAICDAHTKKQGLER